jgi:cardiolipin synthase
VLVDAVGSRRFMSTLGQGLRRRGVACHEIMPVNPIRRRFARVDLRNHRKLFVIDGRVAYTGSQNIVDPDYGRRGMAWHDVMLRVRGPAVLHLQLVFLEDWSVAADAEPDVEGLLEPVELVGGVAMQVAPSGPTYPSEWFSNLLVEAIHRANRHLLITTPYFVPDEPSLLALKLAVMRGARVELVLPAQTDHPVVEAAGRSYYRELLDAGVIIHQFSAGLLHTKSMTVDDAFALVGSANFDVRSFQLNFELNVLLFDAEIVGRLRFMQQHYISQAHTIDPAAWRRRRWHQTLPDNLAMLLSPLL